MEIGAKWKKATAALGIFLVVTVVTPFIEELDANIKWAIAVAGLALIAWSSLPRLRPLGTRTVLIWLSAGFTASGIAQAAVNARAMPVLIPWPWWTPAPSLLFLAATTLLAGAIWREGRHGRAGVAHNPDLRLVQAIAPPANEPPSVARQQAVVRASEAMPDIEAAAHSLGRVWRRLAEQDPSPSSIQNWLSRCIDESHLKPMNRAMNDLKETLLQGENAEPERPLVEFYGAYNALREVCRRFAEKTGQDLALLIQYREWLPRDDKALASLETLRAQPTMESLEKLIRELPPLHRTPIDMPPLKAPPSPFRLNEFRQEGDRLANEAADSTDGVLGRIEEWIGRVCEYLHASRGDEDVVAFGGLYEPHRFMGLMPEAVRGRVEWRMSRLDELIGKYGATSSGITVTMSGHGTVAPPPPPAESEGPET
ncbi:MAG: hypothetical protein WEG36_00785 [Gemmatimonadota bacterium]